MTLEELEDNHIIKDTVKYGSKAKNPFYRDLITRIGYVLNMHENKMAIEDIYHLKLAQAVVCQLSLEQDLDNLKSVLQEYGGSDEI